MSNPVSTLHRELAQERLRGLRTINLLRAWGVSAFFALFLVLGGLLRLPAWTGNLGLFAIYWIIAGGAFLASRHSERVALSSGLIIALVDTPLVFLLQWSTFPTSPSASGVAGFTVGVYVLFVILATLSLERRFIFVTAAAGAAFEILLQHLADVSVGAMISTVTVLGLTTAACSYARDRLVALVGRVEAAAHVDSERRRAEDRLRETVALLGIAQALSGVTDLREGLRRTCRELARLTGADTVAAYLVDRERVALRPTAAYHVPKDLLADLSTTPLALADMPGFTTELEHGGLRWSDRIPEQPHLGLWRGDRIPHQSGLVLPLLVEGQVAGAFYLVWWTTCHRFDGAALALAEAIGQHVGRFVFTARLHEELDRGRQRAAQVERLRALGEMAAGVAHDFNNALAIILGRAQLLLEGAEAPARGALELVVKAAQDAARTVRRIQEFTRRATLRPREAVDLSAVVRDVIEMTRARWADQAEARGIRYEVSAEGGPVPLVLGDAADLREALTNLVFNALDAMPDGGRLALRTRAEGTRVRCEVADTGVGMAEAVRERAFEPFFTTKQEKGSGLGLSIVYGIVTRLGGEITVVSSPGVGSTFVLWLPTAGGRLAVAVGGPAAPRTAPGARVLVVDDEAEVRSALADILLLEGHTPVACADGAHALRALEAEVFDAVLTDLGMPGLSGWDVARAAKQLQPTTPVVLVTGWGDSLDGADARRHGVDYVLPKPFEIAGVRTLLARCMTNREPRGGPTTRPTAPTGPVPTR
jgi:signal transduction histidine kinase/CheY-like chemotaxis protein